MTVEPLPLAGCRHDILGHYLKSIGLLRVLSVCAERDHRDPEAEGWWDMGQACFVLRSAKYSTLDKLITFFEKHYRPTPVFSAWNTGGGMGEKKEVVFSIEPKPWHRYWAANREALLAHGFPGFTLPEGGMVPCFPDKPFELKCATLSLPSTEDIQVAPVPGKGGKPRPKVKISWSAAACAKLFALMDARRDLLEEGINFTEAVKKKFQGGKSEFVFDVKDEAALSGLMIPNVQISIRVKESGKKAVMALLAKEFSNDAEAIAALDLGRSFFERFQADNADDHLLLEEYREECPASASEAFDAVFTTRAALRPVDSPVFLNRGDAGAAEVFRSFWVFFREFRDAVRFNTLASLASCTEQGVTIRRSKGSPFFPDTVKSYNTGSGWVEEDYPFCPLDYLLAVEGAFALRGSAARAIGANSRRFAAFPFVFDSVENLVDDGNEVKGTASALWLPLWERGVTFAELASFIGDAQARLPGKDARFSAEFVRALYAQGVDAGFSGWQEFRFKMKGSRVPWITTGRYVGGLSTDGREFDVTRRNATLLNLALAPLDESRFLDQLDIVRKGEKPDARSPHGSLAEINDAMETAALEPAPPYYLTLLESIFSACRQICISKAFREKLRGGRATFFAPLPMEEWEDLLRPLESEAEFRIARALASMTGLEQQKDGGRSGAEPMLGSLLPLKLPVSNLERLPWYLPDKGQRQQCVWTGEDLPFDLSAVLRRRYLDSTDDEFPALRAVHGAPLNDVLGFLRGELDDRLIARWTEAMSLVDWHFIKSNAGHAEDLPVTRDAEMWDAVEPAYAAFRTLLELECEWQGNDRRLWKKRRSQQPFALLCERSASSLSFGLSEALRWISIWGVPNPWGAAARTEQPRISGRYVVRLDHSDLCYGNCDQQLVNRLAAAVCIPLQRRDRGKLYRAVTLPPGPGR